MAILPGHKTGPGWGAEGVRAEKIVQPNPFFPQPVYVWGFENRGQPGPIAADRVGSMVIGHNV